VLIAAMKIGSPPTPQGGLEFFEDNEKDSNSVKVVRP